MHLSNISLLPPCHENPLSMVSNAHMFDIMQAPGTELLIAPSNVNKPAASAKVYSQHTHSLPAPTAAPPQTLASLLVLLLKIRNRLVLFKATKLTKFSEKLAN